MSAEHIAAAGAAGIPKSVTRQPHPFYEGEFLETVRVVSNALPIPTATAPATASPIDADKLSAKPNPIDPRFRPPTTTRRYEFLIHSTKASF